MRVVVTGATGNVGTALLRALEGEERVRVDMALGVPLMDTRRARTELGLAPRHTAADALLDLLDGMRDGAGIETPPLDPGTGGPLRVREVLSGVGSTSR
jgi:nucleoside-diphosphate-sugar epimerase